MFYFNIHNSYWATLSDVKGGQWFKYVLSTGANWQGNIGKAIIEIVYPSTVDLVSRVIKIEPPGFKIKGSKIYWEFDNFKPIKNINLEEKSFIMWPDGPEAAMAYVEENMDEASLLWAARVGSIDIVKRIIAKKVDVNAIDLSYNTTALMAASEGGYTNIVKLLLKHGANINAQDQVGATALTYASAGGREDTVKLLLEHGADVNIKDIIKLFKDAGAVK